MANAQLVEVKFDGQRFGYWQKVNIRQSVDELCTSLNLSLQQPKNQPMPRFNANTVAEVLINNVLVATVRADALVRHVDDETHTVNLQARSLGRELVDCSYSITLKNIKLEEIVKRICTLFKVPLTVHANTVLVPDFSMQSEQPANAILNAARTGNVLIYPTPEGGLMMTEPTSAAPVATLVYGDTIKSYTINDEFKLRFSEYRVKSFDYGNNKALVGVVVDSAISFFRPMHIVADRHGNALGALKRRAELEHNRRNARANSIELTLFGWGYGEPWQPWAINTQVRVVIPDEEIDAVMLVGDLTFEQSETEGSITNMTLMHRNAFVGEPATAKKHSAAHTRKKAKK